MSLTEQELLDLKDDVDNAKNSVAELKGQLNALLKQLNDDWHCDSIEKAEKELKAIENIIKDLKKQEEDATEALEKQYNTD